MEEEEYPTSIWIKIKCYIFMKLGNSLWNYVIIHEDYWHRTYGISFTHKQDFPKRLKYDMVDMNDDLEVEIAKNQ